MLFHLIFSIIPHRICIIFIIIIPIWHKEVREITQLIKDSIQKCPKWLHSLVLFITSYTLLLSNLSWSCIIYHGNSLLTLNCIQRGLCIRVVQYIFILFLKYHNTVTIQIQFTEICSALTPALHKQSPLGVLLA